MKLSELAASLLSRHLESGSILSRSGTCLTNEMIATIAKCTSELNSASVSLATLNKDSMQAKDSGSQLTDLRNKAREIIETYRTLCQRPGPCAYETSDRPTLPQEPYLMTSPLASETELNVSGMGINPSAEIRWMALLEANPSRFSETLRFAAVAKVSFEFDRNNYIHVPNLTNAPSSAETLVEHPVLVLRNDTWRISWPVHFQHS
jgi:hypothetical protein